MPLIARAEITQELEKNAAEAGKTIQDFVKEEVEKILLQFGQKVEVTVAITPDSETTDTLTSEPDVDDEDRERQWVRKFCPYNYFALDVGLLLKIKISFAIPNARSPYTIMAIEESSGTAGDARVSLLFHDWNRQKFKMLRKTF